MSIDESGNTHGWLTVFHRANILLGDGRKAPGGARWLCRCKCGVFRILRGNSLRAGNHRTCGSRACMHQYAIETHRKENLGPWLTN